MKTLFLALMIAVLSGCATVPPAPVIDHTYTARGQSARVKFVVLHYTVGNLPSSLHTLTEEVVSAHYLLTDEAQPKFYALVDESRQANHAGVSSWKTYANLNPMSIGIEIVNPGYKDTPEGRVWYPFSPAQMDQLIPLLRQIVARYQIPPENILGHSDVAPQRKTDPGPLFPWKQLADAGLVRWPDPAQVAVQRQLYQQQLPDMTWFQHRLAVHGYAVPHTGVLDEASRNVMIAFQMKYRQSRFDGEPDAETAAILDVLTPNAGPAAPLVVQLPATAAATAAPVPAASPGAPAPTAPPSIAVPLMPPPSALPGSRPPPATPAIPPAPPVPPAPSTPHEPPIPVTEPAGAE